MGGQHRQPQGEPPAGDAEPASWPVTPSRSSVMCAFDRALRQAARCDLPVLLVGESGTGKVAYARALHAISDRAAHPFVRVDCPAGVPDLDAEVHRARRGVLFLDEVAALSWSAQGVALKLVDDPLDASTRRDVRVVASSGEDLAARMEAGRFRRDLFYRLSVVELRVPPLRERPEDILPLARAILADAGRRLGHPAPALTPEVEQALLRHPWPGNLTELTSVLERLTILVAGRAATVDALPERVRAGTLAPPGSREPP